MNFYDVPYNTILGRVLRLPLKLIPSSATVPILQGPIRGKRWIAGSSAHGCWLGTTERTKYRVFSEIVKRGYIVYDLGANVGHYSLLASFLVGPEGKVFGFEPVARNLEFLRKHLDINGATNCYVWEAAVGRDGGSGSFDVGRDRFTGHLADESRGALSVRVVRLDDLVTSGELPPPDVIKCDIEGGEYDALSGASGILDRYGPTIFLATHGTEVHQRSCRLLTDLHYRLTSIDGLPLDQTSELLAVRQWI